MNQGDVLIPKEAVAKASGARLIAIDGLPVSGKSTLADLMVKAFGAEVISLDDFVQSEAEWRGVASPGFPFPYMRYSEFLGNVQALILQGECSNFPYDWHTGQPCRAARRIVFNGPVVVQGVSTLHPQLAPLYDIRLWVQSDAESVLQASLAKGMGSWADEWRDLFLPSVELYLASRPMERADFVVKGRGFPPSISGDNHDI
jgi:uridine kinase